MDELEQLIKDESNRNKIADLIYYRYYERYLKIFFYQDSEKRKYIISDSNENEKYEIKYIFNTEYKNGFSIMANCCLLIETLSSFFDGVNETPRGKGKDSFKNFFSQARKYNNELKVFENESVFYCY